MDKQIFNQITKRGCFVTLRDDSKGCSTIAYMAADNTFVIALHKYDEIKEGIIDEDGFGGLWEDDAFNPYFDEFKSCYNLRPSTPEEVAFYLIKTKELDYDITANLHPETNKKIDHSNPVLSEQLALMDMVAGIHGGVKEKL